MTWEVIRKDSHLLGQESHETEEAAPSLAPKIGFKV